MISLDSIDSTVHSIKIEPGTAPIQIGDNGGSLTVDGTVELGATTLAALETITISNTTFELGATTLAALESITVQNGAGGAAVNIQDGGNSITVDGTVELGATTLAALESITVVATDLDIRNLVFATDKCDVSGSSITTSPGGFASWKVTAASATTTESELVGTPLTGRLRIEIQNRGSQSVYLKNVTGVSTANGIELASKSSVEWDLDDGADIFAITGSGTADLRIVEFAA